MKVQKEGRNGNGRKDHSAPPDPSELVEDGVWTFVDKEVTEE